MGQAKSRGTLEQRIAQSIERKHEEARQQMLGMHRAAVNLQWFQDAQRAAEKAKAETAP